MSLYGMMRTGGSGMNAQANRLSAVAENIANASTTGYKRASTEFSSLILPSSGGAYNSGGVETNIRYSISEEGPTTFTTSASDLAIKGEGFFVVAGATGNNYLTRAGAFTQDDSGNLKNSAGYTLQGYAYEEGKDPTVVVNGFDGLTDINLASSGLVAKPSTTGAMGANLDNNAAVNGTPSSTSLSVFDSQGTKKLLDFIYTKTDVNEWQVEIKSRGAAAGDPALGTATLTFDDKGVLQNTPVVVTTTATDPDAVTGANIGVLNIDLSETTQLGGGFIPDGGTVDGSEPSKVAGFEIDDEGIVYVRYENDKIDPRFRIAMANVQSPDNLVPQSGNVYSQGPESGVIVTGFAGAGSFGSIMTKTLEGSNVDIANELTAMIESQRSYTANSKVFQTGSDLLDVLVNLKR